MNHLTPDELIDAMEGVLASDRQSHLGSCDLCQRELAGLSSVLSDAKQSTVPEPSPLFWTHFSARVSDAIGRTDATGSNWPAWLRWQVLAPLGVAAMIILGLMIAAPKQEPVESVALQAPEAPEALQAPENWVMVTELVGNIDLDTASAAGVIEPGVAERAVMHLTAEEQQELTRLLKAELQRAKS